MRTLLLKKIVEHPLPSILNRPIFYIITANLSIYIFYVLTTAGGGAVRA